MTGAGTPKISAVVPPADCAGLVPFATFLPYPRAGYWVGSAEGERPPSSLELWCNGVLKVGDDTGLLITACERLRKILPTLTDYAEINSHQ